MNHRPDPATFITLTPSMRTLVENVIEDLLLLLDEIDGDADFEDQDPDLEDDTEDVEHDGREPDDGV